MSLRHVDFVRPEQRHRVGWVVLVLGLCSLVAAGGAAHRLSHLKTWASVVNERPTTAPQAVPPAMRAAAPPNEEVRARRPQAGSDHDWTYALQALEAATVAPVYTLSVALETSTQSMRVEAEAPSVRHITLYVESIQASPGIKAASLMNHQEWLDPTSQRQAIRFAVVANWGRP